MPSLLFHLLSTAVIAGGAWYQTLEQLDKFPTPGPAIIKAGSFSSNGALKLKPLTEACLRRIRLAAWITRKLNHKEKLSPQAGKRLGKELNKLPLCFSTVELDIEPLFQYAEWLPLFLNAVRQELSSVRKLHVALEPPAGLEESKWSEEDYSKILETIDGIDVMLYDTALMFPLSYKKLTEQVVGKLGLLLTKFEKREIWLGLPTYQDRTKLHSPRVENLIVATEGIKASIAPAFCSKNFQFVFFAGYDMTPEDKTKADALGDWLREYCDSIKE